VEDGGRPVGVLAPGAAVEESVEFVDWPSERERDRGEGFGGVEDDSDVAAS